MSEATKHIQHTPGHRAAAAIIDSPAILDVLCGVVSSRGAMGLSPDPSERQKAIDYLAETINAHVGSHGRPSYHDGRKNGYCHGCGAKISKLAPRDGGIHLDALVSVKDYRDVNSHPAEHVYIESSPSLWVYAAVVRNGGSSDDLCAGCCAVGLRKLRELIDDALAGGAA